MNFIYWWSWCLDLGLGFDCSLWMSIGKFLIWEILLRLILREMLYLVFEFIGDSFFLGVDFILC